MATPSNMRELGTSMPSFNLPDTVSRNSCFVGLSGGQAGSSHFHLQPLPVREAHSPRGSKPLVAFAKSAAPAWSPSARMTSCNIPTTDPKRWRFEAKQSGYVFPYLFDESQAVARAFDAACTPDLYIYDAKAARVPRPIRRQPSKNTALRHRQRRARRIEALLAGKAPPASSYEHRCNIKWKNA